MTTMRIDRRRALKLLSALGVTLAMPSAAGAECGVWLSEDLEFQALQALGREYSAQGGDGDTSEVAALIADAQTDAAAIASLHELIRADYAAARMVRLSHWFVSDTEGKIFAVLGACTT